MPTNIHYLLFDFGGVLVDLDKQRCIRAFDALGFDIRPYLGTFAQGGFFSQLERGEISTAEFCAKVREVSGCRELTDAAIEEAWRSYLLDVPTDRLETLLRAKRHYQLLLLSNTNAIHWAMAQDGYFRYGGRRVEDFFDHVFLSYELHVEKPSREIYRAVTDTLGAPADEILFFDDSPVNCDAARACGLQAVVAPAGGAWLKFFDQDGKLCI